MISEENEKQIKFVLDGEDSLLGKSYPQFIYIDGELVMPLPDGNFLYFSYGDRHRYLNRSQMETLLRMNMDKDKKILKAGSIVLQKS